VTRPDPTQNVDPVTRDPDDPVPSLSSTTFTQSAQKATEFGEIKQPLGLLRRSRSF